MSGLNAILSSALSGDYGTTQAVQREFLIALAERRALPNHPALYYVGSVTDANSGTLAVPHNKLRGLTDSGDYAEGASIVNDELGTGKSTISVGRRGGAYEISDRSTAAFDMSPATPQEFALDALIRFNNKLVDLVADQADGFTNKTGTSGADSTPAHFLQAQIKLEAENAVQAEQDMMALYHSHSWGDVKQDFAEGKDTFIAATPELVALRGDSYKGKYLNTDVFVNNRVPTINAGADYGNAMWTRGAIIWADMVVQPDPDLPQLLLGDRILFEKDRTARAGLTAYVHQFWLGCNIALDKRGVTIQGGV